jgi:hypothetical protein
MRLRSVILLTFLACQSFGKPETPSPTESEIDEKQISDMFKSAYPNRSDEIGSFFNETFGPGGHSDEISSRFKSAWDTASDDVRKFVNETYQNISKIIKAQNETAEVDASMSGISEMIGNYDAALHQNKTDHKHEGSVKEETPHQSMLDTAWNYFKSVFGVSVNRSSSPSTAPHPAAGISANNRSEVGHKGVMLGLLTLLAGLFLMFQTTFNRNSLVNKNMVYAESPIPEVPAGYVRLV